MDSGNGAALAPGGIIDNCASCKFAHEVATDLYCRRNPPSAQTVIVPQGNGRMGTQVFSAWPPVKPGQWCGEYRRLLVASISPAQAARFGRAEGTA